MRHAQTAVLPLLLTGCASLMPPVASDTVQTEQTAPVREYREQLTLNGRLSVRYQRNGRDEALHGSFAWMQTPARTNVTLLSPLGQTIAIIDVTPNGAALVQAGQPTRTAADVDALVADTLGWPLPIAGLREWLQGFAIDANGNRIAATPRTTSDILTPDGWRLRYAGWQNDEPAQPLPKRIDLERPTAYAGDVAIRIVIDAWQS